MTTKPRLLLVEDTPSIMRLYHEVLKKLDVDLLDAPTGARADEILGETIPDVVLLDVELPDANGIDILRRIRARNLPCAVIVVTAHGSVKVAIEAMREGAYDFIIKPFPPDRLIVTVRNALERRHLHTLVTSSEIAKEGKFHDMLGASLPMRAVYNVIENAASSRATVFITGESGTGKELCASAIHQLSPRRAGPFVAVNCAAIPRELMESEMFGHVKGAFTGAVANRDGAISRAKGGTLFLDEICEMDLTLQVKLLRVIQSGEFQKVGGSEVEHADMRYVCATNRDPWAEVRAGRFREDLYYRLHVVPCAMPPLRERGDDVLLLARHFLALYAKEEGKDFTDFDDGATRALLRYAWPGNIRELQNVLRNAVLFNQGPVITEAMLNRLALNAASRQTASPTPIAALAASPRPGTGVVKPLWLVEKEAIEEAIALCNGNIPRAAALLEINPSTIYRRKAEWEKERLLSAG
ncbi:MAG TPA: sigma-54 dependent transcriptional regulator [Stellaceae bacterium]|jgi:two-component system repressor protein LuxO|nr:sigma-54 dependent transcriptional regulator [Stellaceae bacterium]